MVAEYDPRCVLDRKDNQRQTHEENGRAKVGEQAAKQTTPFVGLCHKRARMTIGRASQWIKKITCGKRSEVHLQTIWEKRNSAGKQQLRTASDGVSVCDPMHHGCRLNQGQKVGSLNASITFRNIPVSSPRWSGVVIPRVVWPYKNNKSYNIAESVPLIPRGVDASRQGQGQGVAAPPVFHCVAICEIRALPMTCSRISPATYVHDGSWRRRRRETTTTTKQFRHTALITWSRPAGARDLFAILFAVRPLRRASPGVGVADNGR